MQEVKKKNSVGIASAGGKEDVKQNLVKEGRLHWIVRALGRGQPWGREV